MQARINNPALSVPGALDGLRDFGMSARNADVPEETLALIQLRVSQINGCSVCADMHSREFELLGTSSERLHTLAAWRETPYFSDAERAALALAEAATRLADNPDPVPDAIWDEAASHYTRAAAGSVGGVDRCDQRVQPAERDHPSAHRPVGRAVRRTVDGRTRLAS